MTQRVIDKTGPWRGLATNLPAHMIGGSQCQQGRNFNVDSGRIESDRGFKKIWNTTHHQPGLFFPDPNAGKGYTTTRVGRASYARVAHSVAYAITDPWTIEFKIQIDANYRTTVDPCILSKGDATTGDRMLEIFLNSSRQVRIEYDTVGGPESFTSTGAVALNTPTMVSIVRSGTDIEIFLNGVSAGTGTVGADSNAATTNPLIFGARVHASETDGNIGPGTDGATTVGQTRNNYHGYLDEVRIWSVARSDPNILANIDRELDSNGQANLVAYWKMNEGFGTTFSNEKYTGVGVDTTGRLEWIGPQRTTGLVNAFEFGAWLFDGYGDVGVLDEWFSNDFAASGPVTNDWTVEVNVKVNAVGVNQTILFKGDETDGTGNNTCFHLRINGSNNQFEFKFDDGTLRTITIATAGVLAQVGKHYHIAFGRIASTGLGWLRVWNITDFPDSTTVGSNGYYQAINTTPAQAIGYFNQPTTIGMQGYSRDNGTGRTPEPFSGIVDELRFWSTDRRNPTGAGTPDDLVLELGAAAITGTEAGLFGYWSFDNEVDDWNLGDCLATPMVNITAYSANTGPTGIYTRQFSIYGLPNSLPPKWTNGLLGTTTLDSDGTTILNPPARFTFAQTFSKEGESEELVYGQGCNVYKRVASTETLLGHDLYREELISNSIYADRMYLASENNFARAYIDGSLYHAGLPQPGLAPTFSFVIASPGYQGRRQYVYTYYDERSGVESSVSPVSAIADAGNTTQQAKVTVNYSANPRVTHIRLYATLSTPNPAFPSSTFYRVAEVRNVPIMQNGWIPYLKFVLDTVSNQRLALQPTVELVNDPPRKSKYCQHYMDRMFYVDASKPNRLYFSRQANPDSVNRSAWQNYEENDGDSITAIFQVRSKLIVGKETSVWEQPLGGQLAIPLQPIPRHRDHGIVSHWSIANLDDNVAVYLGTKGVFVYDGSEHTYLSGDIEDQIQNLEPTRLKSAYGAHYRHRNQYVLAVSGSGVTTYNDLLFAWDYRENAWIKKIDWFSDLLVDLRNIRGRDDQFVQCNRWGYLFRYDNGVPDGQENYGAGASTDLSGTATGGTTSTIEDSGATWDNINDGLKGVQINITDAVTGVEEQFTIISNTGTQITFAPARSAAVASGDTYRIGQIDFVWRSKDEYVGDTVAENRWLFLDFHHEQETAGQATVTFIPDRTSANARTETVDLTTRKRSRVFIGKRATFLDVAFSSKEPNTRVRIQSYALTIEPDGKAPHPDKT